MSKEDKDVVEVVEEEVKTETPTKPKSTPKTKTTAKPASAPEGINPLADGEEGVEEPEVPEAPKAPTAVKISEDGATITGKGVKDLIVVVKVESIEVGNGRVGANGAFTVKLDKPLVNEESVEVLLEDTHGQHSPSVNITAPKVEEPEVPEPTPPTDAKDLMYIREMPWRKSAFLVVRFGALYEINKIQEENGEDWTSVEVDESKYKFAKEIKTIAHMIKTYENVEVQESRNGYILNKEQLTKGNFYK